MPASPSFAINGAAVNTKVSIASGGALQAILNSIDGVRSVAWSVIRTDDTSSAATLTASLVQSGSVGQQVDLAAVGGAGTAGILQAIINGGIDPVTERASANMTQTVKWYVATDVGLEVLAVGEVDASNRESNATFGAVVPINAIIRAGGGGLGDFKNSVRVATNGALAASTLVGTVKTANGNGSINPVNGVTLVVGNRILDKDDGTAAARGIFTVTDLGSAGTPWVLTRAIDFDTSVEVTPGCLIPVEEGTVDPDAVYMLTTNATITLGVTALAFANLGALVSLVTAAARGTVSPLGAASTVLTTDGATAGGAWATIVNANVNAAAAVAITKIAQGAANTVVRTNAGATALEHALLVNANIDAAAAIAGTKVAPDFGTQDVTTTGTVSTVRDAIGTGTSTEGLRARNTTAATGGATVQHSPLLVLRGAGWDADDAVSRAVDGSIQMRPRRDSVNTVGASWVCQESIDGGAYADRLALYRNTSDGLFYIDVLGGLSGVFRATTFLVNRVIGGAGSDPWNFFDAAPSTGTGGTIFFRVGSALTTIKRIDNTAETLAEGGRNVSFFLSPGSYGTGTGVAFLANASVVPSTSPVGGGVLYSDGSNMRWRDDAGRVSATTGYVQQQITHADLTAAATSQTLNLGAAVPANAQVIGVDIRLATGFSGGGAATCTVDVGSAGDPDALVDGTDIFGAGAIIDGQAIIITGIAPHKRFAGSTQLTLTVTSNINVVDLAAGDMTIRVLYSVQP